MQYRSHLKVRRFKFKRSCQIRKLKGYFKRQVLKIEKIKHDLEIKRKRLEVIKKLKQKVEIMKIEKERLMRVKKKIIL